MVRRQGKGTFVATHAEQHVQYRFLKLVPDSGDLDSEGPAERTIVDCKRLRAAADVARALALRTGDAVLQVRRVLAYGGVPTILEDLWLPGAPFKGLTAERLADWRGPMYALFETEFGVRMVRAEEKIRAVLPDAAQAALLARRRRDAAAERRARGLHLPRHADGTAARPVPHRHAPLPQRTGLTRAVCHATSDAMRRVRLQRR